MSAIDGAMVSEILNATLPTGSSGKPSSFTGPSSSAAMLLRLTSTASDESAAGTTLSGTGYSDYSMTTSSSASSAGSDVTLPAVSGGTSWTNGSGSSWSIYSVEVQGTGNTRAWYGNFTGAPISVANGNTFATAQNAISVSLSLQRVISCSSEYLLFIADKNLVPRRRTGRAFGADGSLHLLQWSYATWIKTQVRCPAGRGDRKPLPSRAYDLRDRRAVQFVANSRDGRAAPPGCAVAAHRQEADVVDWLTGTAGRDRSCL